MGPWVGSAAPAEVQRIKRTISYFCVPPTRKAAAAAAANRLSAPFFASDRQNHFQLLLYFKCRGFSTPSPCPCAGCPPSVKSLTFKEFQQFHCLCACVCVLFVCLFLGVGFGKRVVVTCP